MVFIIILLSIAAWWIIGYQGFKFWWTHEFDFTTEHRPTAAAMGLLGPFAWIVGKGIHGKPKEPRIIKKKREP